MKVIFTFSDSSTYESSIIRQGFSCQEILFNRLQASDGFVGFSIPFSTTFSNKMTADINNNVLAVVYDDNNNPYATGFVKKEVGYEQKYRNQPIKITIVSKSYMLDKTLNESYALEGYTSAQIVTWLLTQAGISDIGSLSSMTTTVPLFVFNAGENIKDVLKEFCFEYSKTFYFDKNGYFQVADLFISSFTASQTFDRSNIRDKVNINVKEAEANCIRGRWTPLSLVSDTLVFEDKQNATSQYDCVIPIAANSWFGGVEDNFLKCDSTLGEVKYVKSITQNNIQSDSGITKTLDLLERTSLNQLHFTARNTTASVKNITKMQVYANAYIAKENRVDVTTYGNKEKELSLKYIQDQTTAQNFVKALADYYNSTSFTVSFSSDEVCDIGDLVTVSADGIGSFNCRIIQRTRNIITDTIDYVCENIGDYTPAVIVQTVQESLAVNIAGGQKGLDGTPGTPGADGKNAITMTSATTPSGEYVGQMGFWQGQPYMWNGSSWVKQIGDLPTDSVLHYSFDEVPDYPDGTADVRLLDNNTYQIQSTNYNFKNNGGATISNDNGLVKVVTQTGASYYGVFISDTYIQNKIIKIKIKVTELVGTLVVRDGNGQGSVLLGEITATGTYEFCTLHNVSADYSHFYIINKTNSSSATFTVEQIYIGDGSYSTPIIDNANGQWNATNNGGIAVKGVSGKGAYLLNGKSANLGAFNLPSDFSISVWVKPDNNTNSKQGDIIFKSTYLYIRNGDSGNNNYVLMAIYNKTTSSYSYIRGSQSLLPPQKYSHLVLTKNANVVKAYLDGVLERTVELTFTELNDNANNFTLGQSSNTRPQSVDDLLIFDRALTDTEVQALYQNKANTPKYYDLSDYSLDQIDDDNVVDHLTEKPQLLSKWLEIYNAKNVSSSLPTSNVSASGEYKGVIDSANEVGVIETDAVQAYITASNALRSALWGTNGYLVDMNKDSALSGSLDSLFSTYRQTLQKARTVISEQQASSASALTIVNSNPFCLIPVNAGGTVTTYENTGLRLQVFNGVTQLTPKASSATLSEGQWKVTANGTNIIAGSQTVGNGYIDFGNVSALNADTAVITFTITALVNGVTNTLYTTQKFSKSKEGADGRIYSLQTDTGTIVKADSGTLTPSSVTVKAYSWTGSSSPSLYGNGDLKAYENNIQVGSTVSQGNTITVTPSGDYPLVVKLFVHGTNTLLDTLTIPVLQEVKGDAGRGLVSSADYYKLSANVSETFDSTTINTWTDSASSSPTSQKPYLHHAVLQTYSEAPLNEYGDDVIIREYVTNGATGNFTKRIPLYYVNDSATVPNAPTTRVTSTTPATGKTWTQGKYNTYSVGKYYFTVDQIETYADGATTPSSCDWSTVSRDTEYENAWIAKLRSAGQYIGTKSASFTAYTGSSNWDWFLATANFTQQSVSIVSGNVYVWNGSTWTRDTDMSHLSASMKDMMALVDSYTTGSTDIATYATVLAKTLAVQQAFIDELLANQIVVGNLLKSSNYVEATSTNDGNGFQLGSDGIANVNVLKVNGMEVKGSGSKRNLMIGKEALQNITSGTDNLAIGYQAGQGLASNSIQNIAIGPFAMFASTHDSKSTANIAIGTHAGEAMNGGTGNIFLGTLSGFNIATGAWNVEIGSILGECPTSLNDCVAIGYSDSDNFRADRVVNHSVFLGSDISYLKNNPTHTGRYINLNEVVKFFNGNLYVKPTTSTGTIPEESMNQVVSKVSEISNQSTNYLELTGGLTVQWGWQTKTGTITAGSSFSISIDLSNLYKGYYDTYYSVFLTMEGSTTGLELAVTNKTKNGFKIVAYSRNSSSSITDCKIYWLTIGNAIQ